MDFIFKTAVVLMLVTLVIVQLLLVSPYAAMIYTDDLNGSPILSYQTTVHEGYVTLELLGQYSPNSATLMLNGEDVKTIDRFPARVLLASGDVIEIRTPAGTPAFYVYVTQRDDTVDTDLSESTVKIVPGINRILRAKVS